MRKPVRMAEVVPVLSAHVRQVTKDPGVNKVRTVTCVTVK